MTPSDLIALVGAAAAIVSIVVTIGSRRKPWLLYVLLVLLIGLIASAILAVPLARAHWLLIVRVLAGAAIVGFVIWYAVNRYLDRTPKDSIQLTLDPGQVLRTIGGNDEPLSLSGSYAGSALAVRAVFSNQDGYYVQNPEVDLQPNGRWSAVNLQPRRGISELHLIVVGRRGRRYFNDLVREKQFGAMPLPKNCRSVLKLAVEPTNAAVD